MAGKPAVVQSAAGELEEEKSLFVIDYVELGP